MATLPRGSLLRYLISAVAAFALTLPLVAANPSIAQADSLPKGVAGRLFSSPTWKKFIYGYHWASPDHVYLYSNSPTELNVAVVDEHKSSLTITPVNLSTLKAGTPKQISFTSYPLWGGFYNAPDGNFYVATGRDNPKESATREVVSIQKFDSTWTLQGTGYLRGDAVQDFRGITEPFRGGRLDMVLSGSSLIGHMARTMFTSEDGIRHQSNLTFEVDTTTMNVSSYEEAHPDGGPYSSHSFNQFIRTNGNDLVTVDHGDAYPRAIQLGVAKDFASGSTLFDVYPLFKFKGSVGDNYTGTTVTDLEVNTKKALITGNSVPHSKAVGGVTGFASNLKRNVYLISSDLATGKSVFKWVTSHSPKGTTSTGEPRLAKINDTRFALLFDAEKAGKHTLHYRLVDDSGKTLASKTWPGVPHSSASEPLIIGTKLYWAGFSNPDKSDLLFLYTIDIADPAAPRLIQAPKIKSIAVPKIKGSARVGYTLKADGGEWSPTPSSLKYRWYRSGKAISKATKSSYKITKKDAGNTITVKVTASRSDHQQGVKTSAPSKKVVFGPVSGEIPKITGKPRVGATLKAVPGKWGPGKVKLSYQWYRSGTKVKKATKPTYTLAKKDANKTITVKVTGKKTNYTKTTKTSKPTRKVAA